MSAPKTIALLDPFGGLAGDMLVGAVLDLGVEVEWLRAQLATLGLPDWALEVQATMRRHLGCTKADFRVVDETSHRHLPEIRERIAASGLSARAKAMADRAFCLLAEAEARVHRVPVDHVHFHEVGAADAILDICGVSAGLDRLGVDALLCGPLPGGSGTIRCEHGDMPCPAPAVVELLTDFTLRPGEGEGEMVTPTGAALLAAWGRALRPGELELQPLRAGYGAGTRSSSVLRLTLARPGAASKSEGPLAALAGELERDEIVVLETHLDDETPEQLAWLAERLLERGAVDVAYAPLTMKKGRPGVALTVLAPPAARDAALACILGESAAIGVREQLVARTVLRRRIETLDSPWGPVRVKRAGGRTKAEHDDLARIAAAHDLPLHHVRAAIERLAHQSVLPG
ncbi:nickel pincer cofactor biosynthesis protein LarC [Pseudenhygromyxa sp. WMMC2535]|uniref:nickel pincer cofactor biosynthesis protein LarC n=1 Tax=Pseudenhygromyxa sp. WMMC2535 TaxID=2712867 RepID=UPI001551E0DC|nr:nickel pincer cofactor biosynthesis protein LarC [Pseudenhygromyxa sp. WMMC2535]